MFVFQSFVIFQSFNQFASTIPTQCVQLFVNESGCSATSASKWKFQTTEKWFIDRKTNGFCVTKNKSVGFLLHRSVAGWRYFVCVCAALWRCRWKCIVSQTLCGERRLELWLDKSELKIRDESETKEPANFIQMHGQQNVMCHFFPSGSWITQKKESTETDSHGCACRSCISWLCVYVQFFFLACYH